MFPSFQDYVPSNGVLNPKIRAYLAGLMHYARSHGKRPALCEIHSRGRAAALREAFGGFHIAQYRDPLSQFGSFIRPVVEAGEWGFLTFPLMELGINGKQPLYRLVPEAWRVPVLPWPAEGRAQRWSSAVQYMAMAASPEADSMEHLLRWHLFSWTLSNLAAVCYSDFALDIDKTHDNAGYRTSVIDALTSECGGVLDLSDLAKFSRYYEFEAVDVAAVCGEVESAMRDALRDGRVDAAIGALAMRAPIIPAAAAIELLLQKIRESLAAMEATPDRHRIGAAEWRAIVKKNRMIWFNPRLRVVAQCVYPLAAPLARAARRAGIRR
jgi:hypothetical protein